MARNISAKAQDTARRAVAQSPQAGAEALNLAMQGFHGRNPTEVAGKLNSLAALCDQAADHMSLAHSLLVTHERHTDTAISHLDAAIGCLRQIETEGRASQGRKPAARQAKSA
jgi:hypothetical protein